VKSRIYMPQIAGLLGLALLVGTVPAWSAELSSSDWPQFRGPTGQGVASSNAAPIRWSESENIAWKTPIPGKGWSSPVVQGNRIWMTTATEEGLSLRAICVDRQSGKLLKDIEVFKLPEPLSINAKNSHASPTPVLEGGRVYVHFGSMGTACLNSQSGEILWTNRDQQVEHKEGPGSSPILYKDLLIFHCDGMDKQYIVALNKQTGKEVWKTARSGVPHPRLEQRKAYCTPLVIEVDGQKQLISPAADRVFAYDPATGREIWKVEYKGFSNVPRPLFNDGQLIICTGFMKPEMWAIRPQAITNDSELQDLSASNVNWKVTSQIPANPSPIWIDGRVYLVSDQGVASCLDAKTGKTIWKERMGGNFSSSLVQIGNRIYFSNETGTTTVIEAGEKFNQLAVNEIDGQIMASLAVLHDGIFLRSDTHLYKIQDGATAAK